MPAEGSAHSSRKMSTNKAVGSPKLRSPQHQREGPREPHTAYLRGGLGHLADGLHPSQLPVPVLTHKHRRHADVVVCEVSLEERNRKKSALQFLRLKSQKTKHSSANKRPGTSSHAGTLHGSPVLSRDELEELEGPLQPCASKGGRRHGKAAVISPRPARPVTVHPVPTGP